MTPRIDHKKDPQRRCLKLELWPDQDREAWNAAVQEGDVFDDGGLGAKWAPSTREMNISCYGRWLGWLLRQDLLDPNLGPAERVTPERIARYVSDLQRQIASRTVVARVCHLYLSLRAMVPDRDWGWMRGVESRLRKTATSTRNKQAHIEPTSELFAYGIELMERADGPEGGTVAQRAQGFRDGLIIALLAARPFRRRNFASIKIGQELVHQGQDYWLRFSKKQTKTRTAIEVPFPVVLVPLLERYVSHHRPLLNPFTRGGRWAKRRPRPPTPALWISRRGTPMGATTVYQRVVALTKAKFGHPVNPHLFRDSAATSVATEDPTHVHIVKDVLGHSTLKTAERYYMHAQTVEAFRQLQDHVLGLRRGRRDGGCLPGTSPEA